MSKKEKHHSSSFFTKQKARLDDIKKKREVRKRQKARTQAEENYEKELNAKGRTTKTRKKVHSTYHLWGRRLIIANIVVFILLLILLILVFTV